MILSDGIDVLSLPPDRALNLLFHLFAKGRDERDYNKFVSDLEMPDKGEVAEEGVWSKKQMGSDFLAAMNAIKADPLIGAGNIPTDDDDPE